MTIEAKKLLLIRQLMELKDESVLDKMEAIMGEAQTISSKSLSNQTLRELLMKGPVMSDDEFEQYIEIRNWMNEWRA